MKKLCKINVASNQQNGNRLCFSFCGLKNSKVIITIEQILWSLDVKNWEKEIRFLVRRTKNYKCYINEKMTIIFTITLNNLRFYLMLNSQQVSDVRLYFFLFFIFMFLFWNDLFLLLWRSFLWMSSIYYWVNLSINCLQGLSTSTILKATRKRFNRFIWKYLENFYFTYIFFALFYFQN